METTIHQAPEGQHILLTSLGTLAKPTVYELDGKSSTSVLLAPLALVQLLDSSQQPDRVFAMVTDGAKTTTWPVFQKGICAALGFCPDIIAIPDGRSSGEVRKILEKVANEIPEGATLTLDVTQGMRHFPFIFYALALYLTSLRGVEIRGAYYGMFEATSTTKPIVGLQPLLELPKWFHAVRMFRDQGTTKPMADLLPPRDQAVEWLEKYAFAYESALPLELGNASNNLIDSIAKLPHSASPPPLVDKLTKAIISVAEKSKFVNDPRKKSWKGNISLDSDELKRQADMIDLYLDRVQLSLAAGLMREWVVSWAIWKSGICTEIENWLKRDVRERYEHHLGAITVSARGKGAKPASKQRDFCMFWEQLANTLRNTLHHHAMRKDTLDKPPSYLKTVQNFWDQLKEEGLTTPGAYPFV